MSPTPIVRTVLGDIPPETLGMTLSHEHLLCNQDAVTFQPPPRPQDHDLAHRPVSLELFGWLQLNWASNHDNLVLDDPALALEEAQRFAAAGGRSLVDCTLPGIGRNPAALVSIARGAGLNVIMGTGFYVAATHPADLASMDEACLRQHLLREVRDGVDGGSIRAGVIGEIGCSWPLHPAEERVLRAAGSAQRELGCGLTIHPGRHPDAPAQILDVLRQAGADLSRVVIGHIERTVRQVDQLKRLADQGCYLEYDLFGTEATAWFPYRVNHIDLPSDAQRIDQIALLIDAGYGEQILISHDVCTKNRTRRYGGVGYDHIPLDILPWMRERGMDDAAVRRLVIENPRRAFSMEQGG